MPGTVQPPGQGPRRPSGPPPQGPPGPGADPYRQDPAARRPGTDPRADLNADLNTALASGAVPVAALGAPPAGPPTRTGRPVPPDPRRPGPPPGTPAPGTPGARGAATTGALAAGAAAAEGTAAVRARTGTYAEPDGAPGAEATTALDAGSTGRAGATGLLDPGPDAPAVDQPSSGAPVVAPDADPDQDPGTAQPARRRRYRGTTVDPSRPPTAPLSLDGKKPKRGRRRKSNFWRELPILVVVALLLTFVIQTFVARVYEIPSGSMEKTLHGCDGCDNDRVLVDKLTYRFTDPSPGDVVVFAGPPGWQDDGDPVDRSSNPLIRGLQEGASLIGLAPPDEEDFVKRVIAVGGQTVSCCDVQNRVLVDGKPLNEPYIYYVPQVQPKLQERFGPVVVPQGQLWMMGDSRNNSKDSRFPGQGPVPLDDVVGKARFVVLPLSRIKSIPDPNPQEVALSAGHGSTGPSLALGFLGAVPVTLGSRRWRLRRARHRAGPDPGDDPGDDAGGASGRTG
jgi:signal peptidase I